MKTSSLAVLLFFFSITIGCTPKSEPTPTGGGTPNEESDPSTPEGASSDTNETTGDKSGETETASPTSGVSCKIDTDCNPWHCTCSTAGGDQFQQLASVCKNGQCADANTACDPPGKNICGAGSYWTGWAYGGPDGK